LESVFVQLKIDPNLFDRIISNNSEIVAHQRATHLLHEVERAQVILAAGGSGARKVHWRRGNTDLKQSSGVDVMITISGDFPQFSAKKNWRFSQKPML
jgi:hypothetical protein